MLNRRAFLSYSLLFLSGCTVAQTASTTNAASTSQLKRPSRLRFAVTDISGTDELEQNFGAFRQELEAVLELPVEFFPVNNFLDAAPALLANELDFAMAGPSEYLLLKARANAVPLVGLTRPGYYTMVMTRADSDIKTLADLKGQKVAMRTEGSTAGHIVPMKMLLDAGLTPDTYEVLMLDKKSPEALLEGTVSAWVDSYSRYNKFVVEPEREDKFTILTKSENLPPDVLVANPSLGDAFLNQLTEKLTANKETLMTALCESEANKKYKESDMIPVDDTNYQVLRDSYYAIGQGSAIE